MPQQTTAAPRILLEVATASAEDAVTAQENGADRVELNSALMLGGLTPSLGTLIEARARASLPIIAMVRPRAGGFAYSDAEFATMLRDVELMAVHGADGVAFGVLTPDGRVDQPRTRAIIDRLGPGREAVFHRAFDVTPDPFEALEALIAAGVRRVMTSGQEDSAYAGAALISNLIARATGRIEILPAGGINRHTLADVLARTGCDQVHASLKSARGDSSTANRPAVAFGGALRPAEDRYDATDPAAVTAMRERLGR